MYNPTEIIFAATDSCNLHCKHCFVNRTPNKLNIEDAVTFLKSCKESSIDKIGFSGGEPFLYLDFILQITKAAIEMDYMFDQIMTNGDWWTTEDDLKQTLQKLYDAGYDGKIGLSWDSFHGQSKERMETFVKCVNDIFGEGSVIIQSVIGEDGKKAEPLAGVTSQYYLPQTFTCEDERAWQSKRWFKDDFCEGPGQIFYIHPNGFVAPCCGFANENKELYIGTIKDSYSTLMKNAENNRMIKLCYETGLGKYRKELKKKLRKSGKKYPGKCGDICSFCDFVCKKDN